MNNFKNENIGSLLHKLTKYQTLNSNCGSPAKSAIYNQKIAYYSNKLNQMGISSNNINQVGNLIGGTKAGDSISSLIQLQTQRIKDKLAGRTPLSSTDLTSYDSKVSEVENEVSIAKGKYETMIQEFVKVLRVLIEQLMELEKEILNMSLPPNFDLTTHTTRLNTIIGTLKTIAHDDDIAKTYAKSLAKDINDNPAKFMTGGRHRHKYQYGGATHTDLLAVELRQLATLLDVNPDATDLNAEKQKVLSLLSSEITDPAHKTTVDNYINNNLLDRLRESKSGVGHATTNAAAIKARKDAAAAAAAAAPAAPAPAPAPAAPADVAPADVAPPAPAPAPVPESPSSPSTSSSS